MASEAQLHENPIKSYVTPPAKVERNPPKKQHTSQTLDVKV